MARILAAALVATLVAQAGAAADNPLDKAPSHFAKFDANRVHYKSLGEGTTAVVFVHGWCCDHTVWRDQAAAFDGKVRTLYIDLPGYGKSDKPKTDYTMDLFAKGIDAVLKDAGVEQAVLAGHSMGTPVVLQYYRLFPGKTKGLVFVDGGLRAFTTDTAMIEQFLGMFKEETFKETTKPFFAQMFTADTPAEARKHVEQLVAGADPKVAISSMRSLFTHKFGDDPIKVPSQALMAKSPYWDDDYKAFVKKFAPGLDYREFDGVGHFLFLEKTKEVNAALAEFLTKQKVMK